MCPPGHGMPKDSLSDPAGEVGITLIVVSVLGGYCCGNSHFFVRRRLRNRHRYLQEMRIGSPWLNPVPVALMILVFVCTTWDRVQDWYDGKR